jgi:putative ABC transport system ATP-binding protein
MPAADTLIALEGIAKVFETEEVETHALAGVDLTIARGEYVAVSGPSGCGKSTLLGCGLLEAPTAGRYLFKRAACGLDPAERACPNREISFIFRASPHRDAHGVRNVEPRSPTRHRRGCAARRVDEVLERVGMAPPEPPAQLSGGQQQRVAVARALGGRPALLLATADRGLDSGSAEAVTAPRRAAAGRGASAW